jgi:hypothetical protein
MRASAVLSVLLAALIVPSAVPAATGPEFPLASSKVQLDGGAKLNKRRFSFEARFAGDTAAMQNPTQGGATLRVVGGQDEGDSGLITLGNGNWRAIKGGKGYVYKDPTQSAGGIKSIVLRFSKKGGGRIKIAGGKSRWAYEVTRDQTQVSVTLRIGDARFCAVFGSVTTKKGKVRAAAKDAPTSCPCETYPTTFAAIQAVIFERNGCTQQACHGNATTPQGGLDLSPDVAYENLVNVLSPVGDQKRVQPGSPKDSFLYRKLADSTLGSDEAKLLSVGLDDDEGAPMPSLLPPISADELEALRRWIQYGAKKDTITPDTEELLNSCLPPPSPPKIDPPAPPAPGAGIQFHAPPWTIRAKDASGFNGEDEICYSTYYNLQPLIDSGEIPADVLEPCNEDFWGPGKTCFSYKRQELTQDPNSHHSIIHIYNGQYGPNDPGWQNQCFGGALQGQPCDPTVPGVCGDGGICHGKPVSSIACIFGFGPPDYQGSATGAGDPVAPTFSGSQQPYFEREYATGVFSQLPIEGTIVWNSHAFNVTDAPVTNEQWLNMYFARQSERQFPLRPIFESDDIFVQNVPAFEEREYCRTVVFGKGTRISDLSSHTHKRARIFQTWGPGVANSCTGGEPSCDPETSTPLVFKTLEYNDPAQRRYDGAEMSLDGDDPASRRFKFCAIYDNGKTDPSGVKRNSTSPPNFVGGKCYGPGFGGGGVTDEGITCFNNGPNRGKACQGTASKCDSAPGAGDGVCDACPLRGGVTTEDEMFILIGSYYCDPTVPGESCTGGMCSGGARKYEACNRDDTQCPGTCGPGPDRRCIGGTRLLQSCSSDADCPHACVPTVN